MLNRIQKFERTLIRVKFIILICVIGLASIHCKSAYALRQAKRGAFAAKLPSVAPAIQKAAPSVVAIKVNGRSGGSVGSGVIVEAGDGYIVTNVHVIKGATSIKVILHDKREFKAKVVGMDKATDIAIIQIQAKNLKDVAFANSDEVVVGDFVLALGNPFGFSRTVSSGIVSSKNRNEVGVNQYENYIQTDAAINPGNSGGALVNYDGHLIGMNTVIISPTQANVGLGFAIPSNMVYKIANQIIKHGEVKRGSMGIATSGISESARTKLQLDSTHGVIITNVKAKSTAAKAGLKANDVIVSINGKRVISSDHLDTQVALHRIGSEVELELVRDGDAHTLDVRLN